MQMGQTFFRIVEIAFTAYMVPALLVPLAWTAGLLCRRAFPANPDATAELSGLWRILAGLFVLWLLLFLAVTVHAPLAHSGGTIGKVIVWTLYVLTNLLLAWFLLRFTSRYGSIAAGPAADRVFASLLVIVLAQPFMTAIAFAVLYRVMGVAWNGQAPDLPAIQEGI